MKDRYRVRKLEVPVQCTQDNKVRYTTEPRYVVEHERKKFFSKGTTWTRIRWYSAEGQTIDLLDQGFFEQEVHAKDFMERYIRINHPEVVTIVEVKV